MPLTHRASSMSLRQRMIPRRESSQNLRNEGEDGDSTTKWNFAQRIKRRRSAHTLSNKSTSNQNSSAGPVPAVPPIPAAIKINHQARMNTINSDGQSEIHSGWPLSSEPDRHDRMMDENRSRGPQYSLYPPPAPAEPMSGKDRGLFVRLRKSHQTLRNIASPASQQEAEPVRPTTSAGRPKTAGGMLKSARSFGNLLSTSQTNGPGRSQPAPNSLPKRDDKKSFWTRVKTGLRGRGRQPSRAEPMPMPAYADSAETEVDSDIDHDVESDPESTASSVADLSDRHSDDDTEVNQSVMAVPKFAATVVTAVPGLAVTAPEGPGQQHLLTRRVSDLEAQLREARAQLELLSAGPDTADTTDSFGRMDMYAAPYRPYNPAYNPALTGAVYNGPVDLEVIEPPTDAGMDASEMEMDPEDDLPVDDPSEYSRSLEPKTLSTVIEVASQECTPAQQRVEPPIVAQLRPLNLNRIDTAVGGTAEPADRSATSFPAPLSLAARRRGRSMSPVKLAPLFPDLNKETELPGQRLSKLEIAEQVVASAFAPRHRARAASVSSRIGMQALPAELYFLPATTYTPASPPTQDRDGPTKPDVDDTDAGAEPEQAVVESKPRQLPTPSNAASARSRALAAASALPSTLVQTARRPVGPVMPIIPQLPSLPARPPPLRRPSSLPSVSSVARANRLSAMASLILPQHPEEDEDSGFDNGPNSSTGSDSGSENDSMSDEAGTANTSAFRTPASASSASRKTRSALGILSPADSNTRTPPPVSGRRRYASHRRAAAEKRAEELFRPVKDAATLKTNTAKGTVSITFPTPVSSQLLLQAAKIQPQTRPWSTPPTQSRSTDQMDPAPPSPNAKVVLYLGPVSPAPSDKENSGSSEPAQMEIRPAQPRPQPQSGIRGSSLVILLTSSAGSNDPDDHPPDESAKPKKTTPKPEGGHCNSADTDLGDGSDRRRFPPSGGSGVAIPVSAASSAGLQSARLDPETTDMAAGGDVAGRARNRDSNTKTLVASRAMAGGGVARVGGDRSSQLVGARRSGDEWIWPEDVF